MRVISASVLAVLLALSALAQRPHFELDASTPEGRLLQDASQTDDEAKKVELFEEFISSHAGHAGVTYAWMQLQPLYLKAGNFDKVIQAAEAILPKDPMNSHAAYNALQAAEKKNDPEGIKSWSARTVEAAQKMLASPKPSGEDAAEEYAREIDYAKQVIVRCEYSLYAGALAATDPKVTVDLARTLETRHPQSQYIPQVSSRYFLALQQTGDRDNALRVAERGLQADKTNVEMLLVAADGYLQKKELDKSIGYSQELVTALEARTAAPEGMDAAAWESRRKTLLGLGHWMQGMAFSQQTKWAETDKAFRASLPLISGNNDLMAPAYFYLGVANYNMAKGNPKLRVEARRFNEACVKITGPYQQPCTKNLNAITLGK